MPPHQDRYEVSLELVTIAGTEYAMQADLSHYEDVAELEDDILCFLPTVSSLDVFSCELDLLDLHTQQLLPEAFRTVLLQRPQLQIAAWQSCQQLQIVKLSPSVISLAEGAFQGCYVLREVAAPGCVETAEGCLRNAVPRSSWGQSRNRGQQRPDTRGTARQICITVEVNSCLLTSIRM